MQMTLTGVGQREVVEPEVFFGNKRKWNHPLRLLDTAGRLLCPFLADHGAFPCFFLCPARSPILTPRSPTNLYNSPTVVL